MNTDIEHRMIQLVTNTLKESATIKLSFCEHDMRVAARRIVKLFAIPIVSGSADDFEKDLFKLINNYCKNGLKKPDLVNKMKWATGNCEYS